MRKLLLTTVSLGALVGAGAIAQAQTMPMFGGPTVNWTGAYAGAEGGYGWGASRHSDGTGFNSGSFGASGGLVGGTLGYNWQLPSNPFVVGIEGDMSWTDMSGSTAGTCSGACTTKLRDFGTVRGRFGYGFGTWLPYATGGVAFGDLHGSEGGAVGGASGSGSTYRVGWTAGAGVEDAFAPHWSAKLEYLHADLGNGPVFDDALAGGSVAEHVGFQTGRGFGKTRAGAEWVRERHPGGDAGAGAAALSAVEAAHRLAQRRRRHDLFRRGARPAARPAARRRLVRRAGGVAL
jgi:outer membrane immunogenic protein